MHIGGLLMMIALSGVPCGVQAMGRDPIRLQLSNVRSAQFAGYYVAQALGYYDAAGVIVTIVPGAVSGDAALPRAGADVWSAWMPEALAAREGGLKLVNVAQVFLHSGLELVCRKVGNIHSPTDLKGHTVAVWSDGSQIPFLAWMRRLAFSTPGDVAVVHIPRPEGGVASGPLRDRAAACVTALTYDQYWQIVSDGLTPDELQVFRYGDVGVATLQDGLYATEQSLADPQRNAAIARFVRASLQGWRYAAAHQPEAVRIVLASAPTDASEQLRQTRMMSAVARLIQAGLQPAGYLEPAAFDRTVQLLLEAGTDAPIGNRPVGAWTHDIWRRATS